MKIKWDSKNRNQVNLTNLRVVQKNRVISPIIDSFASVIEGYYHTFDFKYDISFSVVGRFVLLINKGIPARLSTTHLCFFEQTEQALGSFGLDQQKIWPSVEVIRGSINPKALLVHNGAIYITPNPSTLLTQEEYAQKTFPWTDTTSSGRWLFPHKDGTRAAYEQMRRTTLEDDYHQLLPSLEGNPAVKATFENL